MHILYDHQIFNTQKRGGVSRYFSVLMRELRRIPDTSCVLAIVYSDNEHLREDAIVSGKIELILKQSVLWRRMQQRFRGYRLVRKAYDFLKRRANTHRSIQLLKRGEYDIFHPTYYDSYFLKYLNKKPFVLTIHDMIHEKYPQYFSVHDKTRERKKLLALHAAHIIAISENTKKDIIEILNIDPDKISVVYHANVLDRVKAKEIPLPGRYLLFVGGRKRYKNFTFFMEAIAPIMKLERDLFIVCVGGDPLNGDEQVFFERLEVSARIIQKSLSDAELVFAYKHALCFVFPSLYEGFGMPILEAFANDCPIAASDTSCFPEIAGDAAVYFDPEDGESIAGAINSILNNPQKRNDLIQKGRIRGRMFSREEMIRKTRNVYQNVLTEAR